MSAITLYHNPHCSKSRAALALLEERGQTFNIIEYLKTPPSVEALLAIMNQLTTDIHSIIRSNEALFNELALSLTDNKTVADWAEILSNNPTLLQRPLVVANGKAAIGRPIENIIDILVK